MACSSQGSPQALVVLGAPETSKANVAQREQNRYRPVTTLVKERCATYADELTLINVKFTSSKILSRLDHRREVGTLCRGPPCTPSPQQALQYTVRVTLSSFPGSQPRGMSATGWAAGGLVATAILLVALLVAALDHVLPHERFMQALPAGRPSAQAVGAVLDACYVGKDSHPADATNSWSSFPCR